MEPSVAALIGALAEHPRLDALSRLVCSAALDAARLRRMDFAAPHRVGREPVTSGLEELTHEDGNTAYGNVIDALERGAERPSERLLLSALLAVGLGQQRFDDAAAHLLGIDLVWLATHTPCNALPALDRVLDERAAAVWEGVACVLLAPESAPPDFGDSETLVAAAALRQSSTRVARALRALAEARAKDPAVRALLVPGAEDGGELRGELAPPPRAPLLTALLAVTLLLVAGWVLRLAARFALGYRRPVLLQLGPRGVELSHRVELLGRVLRERRIVVPLSSLASVVREVRYARAGLYAGLFTLTLGTYFGTGLLVDGLRVPGGSAPLLGVAALLVAAGLALDFVFSSLADSARGRCRIVVVPRKGRVLCIGAVDPRRADAVLSELAELGKNAPPEPLAAPAVAPAPS